MLPAYCHEWREVSPNDSVVAKYEAARIRAVRINFAPGDWDLIELENLLQVMATNTNAIDKAANLIEGKLVQEHQRLEAKEIKSTLIDGNASRRDARLLGAMLFATAGV